MIPARGAQTKFRQWADYIPRLGKYESEFPFVARKCITILVSLTTGNPASPCLPTILSKLDLIRLLHSVHMASYNLRACHCEQIKPASVMVG